jgi:hypothetical protein
MTTEEIIKQSEAQAEAIEAEIQAEQRKADLIEINIKTKKEVLKAVQKGIERMKKQSEANKE